MTPALRKKIQFSIFKRSSFLELQASVSGQLDNDNLKQEDLTTEYRQAANAKACDASKEEKRLSKVGPRRGELTFGEVKVPTPVFMPVGTLGSVKALSPEDVYDIGYRLILGNTYHLNLRPGMEIMRDFGGLHHFMGWPGAILTDSGGFQVMSLAKMRQIKEDGVTFASHIDGRRITLTPENVVDIQNTIDSDIQMVLDECTPHPATWEQAKNSMELSMRWAKRARDAFLKTNSGHAQFGIIQGGMYGDLRAQSAQHIAKLGFEGIAIGGLSVGESPREMRRILAATVPHIPHDTPRYLMGVGTPTDLFDAVMLGIDMFDCVLPTRNARNGSLFVRTSESETGKIQIKNAKHKTSKAPIDANCSCYTCQNYSKGYLRHLFVAGELLAFRLLTIHNLHYLHDLMQELRDCLQDGASANQLLAIRETYVGKAPSPD